MLECARVRECERSCVRACVRVCVRMLLFFGENICLIQRIFGICVDVNNCKAL